MSRSDTFFIGPNVTLRQRPVELVKGETRLLSANFNAYLGSKSTTLSSASWTNENSAIAISGPATGSGVASVNVEGVDRGRSTLKVTGILASGEEIVRKFTITVIDPETGSASDYS